MDHIKHAELVGQFRIEDADAVLGGPRTRGERLKTALAGFNRLQAVKAERLLLQEEALEMDLHRRTITSMRFFSALERRARRTKVRMLVGGA